MSNYPMGVSDDDPFFTDKSEPEEIEPNCPHCGGLPSEHLYNGDWLCLDEQEKKKQQRAYASQD